MKFPIVYAVKHKDMNIRMNSRSGGIFTALSDKILSENGVVYGCILNEDFEAVHVRAETAEERDKMRGSKYIQSSMGDTFHHVAEDLKNGSKVLFSGTSCQIAGLKAFLGKADTEQLLCVDIVCHGVPSTLVWKKYLAWQEQEHHGKIVSVDFRNKKDFGWAAHVETLTFKTEDGSEKKVNADIFKRIFLERNSMRPACYQCPYKDIMHPADITIADYWGIDNAVPDFNDDKGVSLVLLNHEKSIQIFEELKENLEYRNTRIEDSMQPALKQPFSRPASRQKFWNDFRTKPFSYIAKTYGTLSCTQKIKRKLKKYLKK